jgi:hypothetical protein
MDGDSLLGVSTGKGDNVKTGLFTRILTVTLFHTTLLSTMLVLPLVLATRYDARLAARDAQAKVEVQRDRRLPQTDAPVTGPAARQAPIDRSGPDAAMIRPVKARAKTIKL